MVFTYKDIPQDIKPVETAYGQKWTLSSEVIHPGVVRTVSVVEVLGGRNTAMTAKPEDIIHVAEDGKEYNIRKHPRTHKENVEVGEGAAVRYVKLDRPTGKIKITEYAPGKTFSSVSEHDGQDHTMYAPGTVLLKITAEEQIQLDVPKRG